MSRQGRWRKAVLFAVAQAGVALGGCELLNNQVVQDVKRAATIDGTEPISVAVADPQSAATASVRSIAVLDFTGHPRMGEWLGSTVAMRLSASGRFEVKDRPTVARAAVGLGAGAGVTAEQATRVGKALGVDAVLVGELVSVRGADAAAAPAQPTTLPAGLGRPVTTVNQNVSAQSAELIADFRVVQSGTGKVLLTRRANPSAASYNLTALQGLAPPPTADAMLGRLAGQCAEQIAADLSRVGTRLVERKFARGWGTINRGNTFARQGAFDYAERLYRQAIEEKPTSAGAYYNLGLLREAAGDLAGAVQNFEKAMTLSESELYIAAFQRARTAQGPLDLVPVAQSRPWYNAHPPYSFTPERVSGAIQ
jgi:hypothetical protein